MLKVNKNKCLTATKCSISVKYNGELEKSYMVELYFPNVKDRLLSDLVEFIGLAAFCSCCGNKK